MFKFTIGDKTFEYEAEGLTKAQAGAVATFDAGLAPAEATVVLTELVGKPSSGSDHRTVGSYGNLKVNGLRALGRESEVEASTGGGGVIAAKVTINPDGTTNVEALRKALDKVRSAEAEVPEPLTVEAFVEAESERLRSVVKAANAELKALREAEAEALTDRVEALNDDRRTAAEAKAEATRNKAEAYEKAIAEAEAYEAFRASRVNAEEVTAEA